MDINDLDLSKVDFNALSDPRVVRVRISQFLADLWADDMTAYQAIAGIFGALHFSLGLDKKAWDDITGRLFEASREIMTPSNSIYKKSLEEWKKKNQ